MATPDQDSVFQKWNLSPREHLEGQILNSAQKMFLQNELAKVVESMLNLTPHEEDRFTWIEFQGQKILLQRLLESSDTAERTLIELHTLNNS